MTVKYQKGDLFDHFKQNCVLVHGCNAQHVMGSGVALIVKTRYPQAYYDYMNVPCLRIGTNIITRIDKTRYIVNAITQVNYGRSGGPYADIGAIETCLADIKRCFPKNLIIMPEIGCGLGGLSTTDVFPIIEDIFYDDQECWVFSL